MKRIFILIAAVCLMFSLIGCKKCIDERYESVEVTIVDEYHRGMYVIPMRTGKVTSMITHPAVYEITVQYNGVYYDINGQDTYYKFKDKIGQTATGTLKIRTYDDGSVKYNITEIK